MSSLALFGQSRQLNYHAYEKCANDSIVINGNLPFGVSGTWSSKQNFTQLNPQTIVYHDSTNARFALTYLQNGDTIIDSHLVKINRIKPEVRVLQDFYCDHKKFRIKLHDSTSYRVTWEEDGQIQNMQDQNQGTYIKRIELTENSTVSLKLTNAAGCKLTERFVMSLGSNGLGGTALANILSPDGNGFNDSFGRSLVYQMHCPEYNLSIYSRWGTKVYESKSPKFRAWDGIDASTNELCPAGVYYYMVEFGDNDLKGSLYLLR